ncbi:MAG TPA: PH domain-containing protein [Methanofastidiosum sp.]|nr:PH domain-containing protein [Methanofastidiosum sp.]HNU60851.1 PH domain-containing protein [Methanofastidiosum sp.]
MGESSIKIGQEFGPSVKLKNLYYVYLLLVLVFGVFSWYLPTIVVIYFFSPQLVKIIVTLVSIVPLIAAIIFILYWIPKYFSSIIYKMTETEITWNRGVWFKIIGVVPYNRITNIDIKQGPISRGLGIASLKIQTAGYSASSASGGFSEIKIDGMKNYSEVRDMILDFVRGKKPEAVETYETLNEEDVKKELVKIRELLEEKLK